MIILITPTLLQNTNDLNYVYRKDYENVLSNNERKVVQHDFISYLKLVLGSSLWCACTTFFVQLPLPT